MSEVQAVSFNETVPQPLPIEISTVGKLKCYAVKFQPANPLFVKALVVTGVVFAAAGTAYATGNFPENFFQGKNTTVVRNDTNVINGTSNPLANGNSTYSPVVGLINLIKSYFA